MMQPGSCVRLASHSSDTIGTVVYDKWSDADVVCVVWDGAPEYSPHYWPTQLQVVPTVFDLVQDR